MSSNRVALRSPVLVKLALLVSVAAILAVSCSSSPTTGGARNGTRPANVVGGGGTTNPVPVPTPPPVITTNQLRWAPPALVNPITVQVSTRDHSLKLDPNQDYIVQMPQTALVVEGGLSISGGHNVVMIGGHIHHDRWWNVDSQSNRALYLIDQTGTVHIEGLYISGELAEGIDLNERAGATVQIQNVRIEQVTGSQATNHADVIQTWAGPNVLRVHRLTGKSTYQGIFMRPNDTNAGFTGAVSEVSLDTVQIYQTPEAGYAYWKGIDRGINYPVGASNLWISDPQSTNRSQVLWPKGDATWAGVQFGTPPGGDFVPAGAAGIGYVSPGYI